MKSFRLSLLRRMQKLVLRTGRRFYLYLAILLSVVAAIDLTASRLVRGMHTSTFDLLMRNRISYPTADKEIVIIDVDDASLNELAATLGRWPWPRRAMGEVVEGLEAQGVKAVVFDVLFSASDLANPQSDKTFAEVVTRHANVHLSAVRLDDLSVRPTPLARVPFAQKATPDARDDEQVAIALPYFADQIAPGQLGITNVIPEQDGVIRRFSVAPVYRGWRIASLPFQLANSLGYAVPEAHSSLINWRGPPYSFRRASFSNVYSKVSAHDGAALARDFRGKIVVIGSTAASLFDVKASPMAGNHPGVEILATVIDNVKNGDFLREQPNWLYAAIAVAFIWILAISFYNRRRLGGLDTVFIALQALFVLVTFAALNLGNQYIDLTTPVTFGAIYFALARPYAAYATHLHANRSVLDSTQESVAPYRFSVMAMRSERLKPAQSRSLLKKLDMLIETSAMGASKLDEVFATHGYIGELFDQTVLVYWLRREAAGGTTRADIDAEAARMAEQLLQFAKTKTRGDTGCLRFGFRDELLPSSSGAPHTGDARAVVLAALRALDEGEAAPVATRDAPAPKP